MVTNSKIEWTENTWNPSTGCTKISQGCKHCYAEIMAKRLKAMKRPKYCKGFEVTTHPKVLNDPLKWKTPRRIFVNSMSDLFHDEIPEDFIHQVFGIMHEANWHIYQILTKRSERLMDIAPRITSEPHIWMGVTVESQDYLYRIDHLRQSGAKLKFLSLEPLLSPMPNMDLTDIDWVIVGGESLSNERPMDPDWVRDIRDQCLAAKVPFFFKQWGGFQKKKNGRILDGRTWDEYPGRCL